jgi:Fe-S cluster assembly protein SufB
VASTIDRELAEKEIVDGVNVEYAEKYGFSDAEDYVFKAEKGLNEDIIRFMSQMKKEPEWMLDIRLKAYHHFLERPMPEWGADISDIDFDDIYYYIKPSDRQGDDWEDVPPYI